MEHKSGPGLAIKIDGELGIVEHIFAVMGNVDLGNDRLWPNSFRKTLTERGLKVRVLDAHRTGSVMDVLGKPLELREIGRDELPAELLATCPEATGGVFARTQFLMDTPEGAGAFARIKASAIDEYSFGYDPIIVDYTKEMIGGEKRTVRNLREIKLHEYSPVLFGMNPVTVTLSAKADDVAEAKTDGGASSTSGEAMDALLSAKEWTPSGPVQRLGDVLQGRIHEEFTRLADGFYQQGYMNTDERIALSSAIGSALETFVSKMPAEVAGRRLDGRSDQEMATMGAKAGRVLAARNAERLRQALATLNEILQDAGLLEDALPSDAQKSDAQKSDAQKSVDDPQKDKAARPGADSPPPTEASLREWIRARIGDLGLQIKE